MDALSESVGSLATSLLTLSTAAALDQSGLAQGCFERIEELAAKLAGKQFAPFAATGALGDVAAVGETTYASAHHAIIGQAQLALDILNQSGIDRDSFRSHWEHARGVILEWFPQDWQQQFRPIAARRHREAAANAENGSRRGEIRGDAGVNPPSEAHSPDFRSVNWFGENYPFTANQAACVKVLWEAWQTGAPDVGGETLLQAADTSMQRIDVVFRDNRAWGTMIVQGSTKGSYRLAEPTGDSPKRAKRAAKKTSARARK